MKLKSKIVSLIVFLVLSSSFNLFAQESDLELGVRYLKLGNSYREANNFDKAKEYLFRGYRIVKDKSVYWEAAAYEFMGYYYRDAKDNPDKALGCLRKAQSLFNKVIAQKDGSQKAMGDIIDRIQKIYLKKNELNNDIGIEKLIKGNGFQGKSKGKVIYINLSGLNLKAFPNGLTSFTNLQFLDLSDNQIPNIPVEIAYLSNLWYLDLSNNNLKDLPRGICNCKSLKAVNLKGNNINYENLINIRNCLPNAKIFHDKYELSRNESESQSEEQFVNRTKEEPKNKGEHYGFFSQSSHNTPNFGNTEKGHIMSEEKLVKMSRNSSDFSEEQANLYWKASVLEYLGNHYRDVEDNPQKAIEYFEKAREIYEDIVEGGDVNPEALSEILKRMKFISSNIEKLKKEKNKDTTDKVEKDIDDSQENNSNNKKSQNQNGAVGNYDNQKLRQLPPDLDEGIENLSLANNKFRDFPNRLLDFPNLQFLNLSNNKIKKLPQDINDLSKLIYLDLSDNDLEEIPRNICGCENLQVLNLKGNEINFESLTNIIRCLPNTNILFDEYEPKSEEETEDYLNY